MLSYFNGSLTYSISRINKAIRDNGPDFCFSDYKNLIDLLQDIYKEFNESTISQIIEIELDKKNGSYKTFEFIMIELNNVFVLIRYFYESSFSKKKHDEIF